MIKALFIDGMGAPGIVWNALAVPMREKYLGKIEATYCEWQHWMDIRGIYFDVVVGHSLGGHSAIQYCNWHKDAGWLQPKLLMTLAPRYQSATSWLDFIIPLGLQKFKAPNNVCHNFYTIGLLSSQAMDGAVENVNVTSLSIWHANVPAAKQVHDCFDRFMAGQL